MTVANELDLEHRHAPCAPLCIWRGMRRAHDPPRLRRRRLRRGGLTQDERGHAGGLRGQRQLAAGDEIELPRLAPDFQHDHSNRIAGERIGGGPQRGVHIGGTHAHHIARVEPELGQSAHRQCTRFNLAELLAHPDQRPT